MMKAETKTRVWTRWIPAPGDDLVPQTHWEVEGDEELISILKYGWFPVVPGATPFSPEEGKIEWVTPTIPTPEEYAEFRRRVFGVEVEIRKILSVIRATTQSHPR